MREAFDIDDESVPAAPFAHVDGRDPVDGDGEAGDLLGDGSADGGFSDTDRLVRVWLDEGRLVKVRVSPVWFSRIGTKDTLASHFREALCLAALDRASSLREIGAADPTGPMEELAALPDEVRAIFESIGPLSSELLVAVDAVHSELSATTEAAMVDVVGHEPRSFTGRSQGVRVTLDQSGNTSKVDFDESWLDQAQVGSIATHVQLAADRAQSDYASSPPTHAAEEALEVAFSKQRLLSCVLTAILNPRNG